MYVCKQNFSGVIAQSLTHTNFRAHTLARAHAHTQFHQLVHVLEVHRKRDESAPDQVREVPLTSQEFWAYYKQDPPSHVSDCMHGEGDVDSSSKGETEGLENLRQTLVQEKGTMTKGFENLKSIFEATFPNSAKVQQMKDLERIFDRCLNDFSASLNNEETMISKSKAVENENRVKETDLTSLIEQQELLINGLIKLDLEVINPYMMLIDLL